mmetsp:Transcript_28572/g.62892  ORF Transcript_28572/g.62892 Transcript_28572/m.62892 type:complete len:248 (-) Transcript_28572:525-1268(-)
MPPNLPPPPQQRLSLTCFLRNRSASVIRCMSVPLTLRIILPATTLPLVPNADKVFCSKDSSCCCWAASSAVVRAAVLEEFASAFPVPDSLSAGGCDENSDDDGDTIRTSPIIITMSPTLHSRSGRRLETSTATTSHPLFRCCRITSNAVSDREGVRGVRAPRPRPRPRLPEVDVARGAVEISLRFVLRFSRLVVGRGVAAATDVLAAGVAVAVAVPPIPDADANVDDDDEAAEAAAANPGVDEPALA